MTAVPEIRFPEFDGDWEHLTLGDVGPVSMCKRIFKEETAAEGDVPFYKIGTFGKAPDVYVKRSKYLEYRGKYSFPNKGDILISAAGTIGRTVIYDGEDAYFQDSNIVWIANDERRVANPFLFLCYENIRWTTENTTIARLYNANLRAKKFAAPTLPEQQKIAAFLGAVDDKIDALRRKHDGLKQFKSGLMQKLFTQDLRFKRDDGSDYPDWKEKRLGDVLHERKESAPKSSGLPHISLTTEGVVPKTARYDRDFLVRDDEEKKYKVTRLGDLCYNPANLKFGVISMNKLGDGLFSPIYVTFEIQDAVPEYIEALVKQPDFQKQVRRYEQGTVYERMAVSAADFVRAKIAFPHPDEQQKIADCLSAVDAKIEAVDGQITQMEAFKKGLLQKMFV